MAGKSMEIIIRAKDEFSGVFNSAFLTAEAGIQKVKERFDDLSLAHDGAASGAERIVERYRYLSGASSELAGSIGEIEGAFGKLNSVTNAGEDSSLFWFLDTSNFSLAKEAYLRETGEFYEAVTGSRIGLAEKEFLALNGYNTLHKESIRAREAVESKAYQAMGDQLLRLIEIHRFSVKEFGKAIAQQVKMELTGLAAKAAVWAIFETAMGFRDLAIGLPTAALHFKSAAEFGAVAGAALIAAAGVQEVFGGQANTSSSGSGGGSAKSLSEGLSSEPQAATTQYITIQVYNPLSEQNWQKIVDDNIIPALKDAGDRNVAVTVKQA